MALTHCLGCGTLTRTGSYCGRCSSGGRKTYRWTRLSVTRRQLDGHRCVYCGSTEDLTADLDPRLRSNHRAATINDCVTACRACNASLR